MNAEHRWLRRCPRRTLAAGFVAAFFAMGCNDSSMVLSSPDASSAEIGSAVDMGSGACIDDGFENNDSRMNAVQVPLPSPVAPLQAVLCDADDEDWFSLSLDAADTTITITGRGDRTVQAFLLNGEGVPVADAEGAVAVLEFSPTEPGDHFLLVRDVCCGDGNPYEVFVTQAFTPPCEITLLGAGLATGEMPFRPSERQCDDIALFYETTDIPAAQRQLDAQIGPDVFECQPTVFTNLGSGIQCTLQQAPMLNPIREETAGDLCRAVQLSAPELGSEPALPLCIIWGP